MPHDAQFTADHIRTAAFSKPPMGRRGYGEDDVDEFLDALEAKFANPADPALGWLTPAAVRARTFARPPIGMRGYHEGEVDALLELCAVQLARLTGGAVTAGSPVARPGSRLTSEEIVGATFSTARFGGRGYDRAQVDTFLDAVAARFRDPADPAVAWLTPAAVTEARFAPSSFGRTGYRSEEIDAFLARCATDLELLLRRA
ncbi:DivIVA domain-containing protein [Gordonia sp. PP30]|uniref:DivIVA domain-containing protein n=1 Tax=Gordonia sp. PP30 TaxID=2935861 RepID=UPI001FFFD6CA|nr:DivIVA domain-containing protein [Gordonia sp. PP30]UQE74788.1 DivIVA domain-containing protein [Gordonia sp. PP30]